MTSIAAILDFSARKVYFIIYGDAPVSTGTKVCLVAGGEPIS